MTIFNRRNALFGWLAWTFAKQVAKRKAKSQLQPDERHRGMSAAAAATIAAAVGGLLFWRRRSRSPGADQYGQ